MDEGLEVITNGGCAFVSLQDPEREKSRVYRREDVDNRENKKIKLKLQS